MCANAHKVSFTEVTNVPDFTLHLRVCWCGCSCQCLSALVCVSVSVFICVHLWCRSNIFNSRRHLSTSDIPHPRALILCYAWSSAYVVQELRPPHTRRNFNHVVHGGMQQLSPGASVTFKQGNAHSPRHGSMLHSSKMCLITSRKVVQERTEACSVTFCPGTLHRKTGQTHGNSCNSYNLTRCLIQWLQLPGPITETVQRALSLRR